MTSGRPRAKVLTWLLVYYIAEFLMAYLKHNELYLTL